MIVVRPFHAIDLVTIAPFISAPGALAAATGEQPDAFTMFDIAEGARLARDSAALTFELVSDCALTQVLAVGGVQRMDDDPDMVVGWALVSNFAAPWALPLARAMKKAMAGARWPYLIATVDSADAACCRWARLLGLKDTGHLLPNMTASGGDLLLLERR